MIQVIMSGDVYSGDLGVHCLLQCPDGLDLESEWEKYAAAFKEECGAMPRQQPGMNEWSANRQRILSERYLSLHPKATELPKEYILTYCFVATMIFRGCEQLEYNDIWTEE